MYKSKNINFAFTLIEILVSITILSIIMVSVMYIFLEATNLSAKTDINRVMQENIKNVIETITEDIRKNGIKGVSENVLDTNCDFNFEGNYNYKLGTKLCTSINNTYFLVKKIGENVIRIDDISLCESLKDECYIVKNGERLTNSSVSIKNLKFYLTDDYIPKVTIIIEMQPSVKKGVKPNLIKNNKIVIQTTISEKVF